MMTFRLISDIIVDAVIIAVALYALWRLARYIRGVIDDARTGEPPADNQNDPGIWDVLADVRRITEDAAEGR